jgi:hypothetical protein
MTKHTTHKDRRDYLTKGDLRRRRNRDRLALAKTIAPVRTAWGEVAR